MSTKKSTEIRTNTGDVTYKSSASVVSAVFGQTLATPPSKTTAANFSHNHIVYKPAVTVTPAAFNAQSANAAFEAKYPATTKANFR
jgi:hypothetical protein